MRVWRTPVSCVFLQRGGYPVHSPNVVSERLLRRTQKAKGPRPKCCEMWFRVSGFGFRVSGVSKLCRFLFVVSTRRRLLAELRCLHAVWVGFDDIWAVPLPLAPSPTFLICIDIYIYRYIYICFFIYLVISLCWHGHAPPPPPGSDRVASEFGLRLV